MENSLSETILSLLSISPLLRILSFCIKPMLTLKASLYDIVFRVYLLVIFFIIYWRYNITLHQEEWGDNDAIIERISIEK